MRRTRITVFTALCFTLLMQAGVYAQQETKSKFKVVDTAFCPEIEPGEKWCGISDINFSPDVGRLYCCTRIFATEDGEIYHNWIYNGKSVASVELKVLRSGGYRTRSYKSIYPKQIGEWRVEVVAAGEVISTLPFIIAPAEQPEEDMPPVSSDE